MQNLLLIVLIVAGVALLIVFMFLIQTFGIWLQSFMAQAPIPMKNLIGMKLRRSKIREIVLANLVLAQKGFKVNIEKIEAHSRAGGNVRRVSHVLLIAKELEIPLDWDKAAALDLMGEEYLLAMLPEDKRPKYSVDTHAQQGMR